MFSAANKLFKSQLKVFIETCVEQRVDQRIHITEPGQKVGHFGGHDIGAQTYDQLFDEERQPGQDEGAQNETQDPRCLALPGAGDLLALSCVIQVVVERGDPNGGVGRLKLRGRARGGEVGHAERLCQLATGERVLAVCASVAEVPARTSFLVKALGCVVDPVIENQYQGQGDVEGPQRGVDGVEDAVVPDGALARRGAGPAAAPPEQRGHGDGDGDGPDREDHDARPPGGPLPGVLDGVGDGPVPVQGDHAEVQDGAGAAGHVHTQPHLADEVPQPPAVHGDVHDAQGHDEHGHQEVRHGEGADQVVGGLVELLGGADGHDHGGVQQRGQGGDGHQSQADEHLLRDAPGSPGHTGLRGAVSDVHLPSSSLLCSGEAAGYLFQLETV